MLRISKLTDYAIILMVYISKNSEATHKASELAKDTKLASPTVAKLLKKLTKYGLLTSIRGVMGGYKLVKAPGDISIANIITAIEGEMGLTACSIHENLCDMSNACDMKKPWIQISKIILDTLADYKLSNLLSASTTNNNTPTNEIRTTTRTSIGTGNITRTVSSTNTSTKISNTTNSANTLAIGVYDA